MSVVDVRDLRVELSRSGADVVDDVSFTIEPGEVLGLVGESGSGKTTIGVAMLGDARRGTRIAGGQIFIDGEDILTLPPDRMRAIRGSRVAYIPQDPSSALNPALRIGAQLRELFEFHARERSAADVGARLAETLEEVGLPGDEAFLRRFPHQLSGGQQQRIAIAMAFLLRPRVIVLDEPTTGLDVTTQARVLRTVRELCEAHRVAALYVTHDLAVVANLAHRILVLYAGRAVELGTARQLFQQAAHPYTRRLIAAIPLVRERRRLLTIAGQTPAPGARPQGCAFHPRCSDAQPRCAEVEPRPQPLAPGHRARCLRATELRPGPVVPPEQDAGAVLDADTPLLTVAGLAAFHGSRPILRDVSLELRPRECLALVGESGSGKTTMSRCIIGLHAKQQSMICLKGETLPPQARKRTLEQRRVMQYIFQSPYNSLNPRRSVGDILRVPLELFFSLPRREIEARITAALDRVSLRARAATQYPHQLSGGERQRVAIARALVSRPEVLICDEITSALDVSVQASIVDLLRELRAEDGLALLFVTHNLALVRTIADRVITLNRGCIVEAGPTEAILDHPADPYTQRLIADTPTIELTPARASA